MFSSYIIGETTLVIRCGEILLGRGHTVLGVISTDANVSSWAASRGIQSINSAVDLLQVLTREPYDYLFSVVNDQVLGPDVLATPLRGAINYHDGPLPRYAGMHVTSWAIMHGETVHGITWHEMAAAVDGGHILKSKEIAVAENDTALSLNAKCYEAATEAFAELVDALDTSAEMPREQDLGERTYFSRYRRPPAAGVLSWHQNAKGIAAQVRALDFGPYANPLGRPKIAIGSEFLVCSEIEVLDTVSSAPPGTITAADESGFTVATLDNEVAIRRLLTLDGAPADLRHGSRRSALRPGRRLSELDASRAARVTALDSHAARNEAFWVGRLRSLRPPALPYLRGSLEPIERVEYGRTPVSVPANFPAQPEAGHKSKYPADALVTAFAVYLRRIAGDTEFDINFQTPSLRREVAGIEGLIAAQLPCRIELDTAGSFADACLRVGEELEATRGHGPYARDIFLRFPDLRDLIQRRVSHTLPISVAIVDQESEYQTVPGTALCLVVRRDARTCQLVYDPTALSQADAQRMAGHLTTMLAGIAAQGAAAPLWTLPLLTSDERHQMLVTWNDTDAAYERTATVHSLFESQVARDPQAIAVEHGTDQLTYSELNERAGRLAYQLRALGVGADTLVGLRVERSFEMVVGLLGILKAGGAYLPLDVGYPAERTAFVLDDARVPVLVTQERLLESLPPHAARVVCLDSSDGELNGTGLGDAMASTAFAEETRDATADNLAYVIYTSGSTGRPKGVLVHHRAVVNYLTWSVEAYGLRAGSGAPVHSTLSFDLTVTSLLAPLVAGRTAILLDEQLGVEALATALRTHTDLSAVKITPSHLDFLQHQLSGTEVAGRTRSFVIGGENLRGNSLVFWQQHAPGTVLVNEYGPTETVVGCCVYRVAVGENFAGAVPIGRPIANTRLYVLDSYMQPVPVGVSGELFIGGDGVTLGYLNRPELTAERFIADPFSTDESARLYRSGDCVRYHDDGNLEFLGRFDDQVKLRGYRIELGGIEATLSAQPDVSAAAAALHEVSAGDARLVAYYVPRHGEAIAESTLRKWFEDRMPSYMIPSAFVALSTIPLTDNGKVDRASLPVPTAVGMQRPLVAARSIYQQVIAEIWEEVLGVPVGLTDDFFDLGGHSLLAVQMIAHVAEVLGTQPPLAVLLTRPTVEHLADAIATSLAAEPQHNDSPVVKVREGDAYTTPFFFLHGSIGGGGYYCNKLVRELDAQQPVYLIQPHQPGGPGTIEEMAADRLKAIREIQPTGPYQLGGTCNGGLVAFEIAQQLRAQGEDVSLLALVNTAVRTTGLEYVRAATAGIGRLLRMDNAREVDTYIRVRDRLVWYTPTLPRAVDAKSARERAAFALSVGSLVVRIAAKGVKRVFSEVLTRGKTLSEQADQSAPIAAVPASRTAEEELESKRSDYFSRATKSFVPHPYTGRIALIFWEQSDAAADLDGLHRDDWTRGWGRISPDVDVRFLAGDGQDVISRDASSLGREIATLLQEAQEAQAARGVTSQRPPEPEVTVAA